MATPLPEDTNDPIRRHPSAGLVIDVHGPWRRSRRWFVGLFLGLVFLALLAGVVYVTEPEYAYVPPLTKILNAERGNQAQAFDVWGRSITRTEAATLHQTASKWRVS
jgi:hypothetical protein